MVWKKTFISSMRWFLDVNLCCSGLRYRPGRGENTRLQQFPWAKE